MRGVLGAIGIALGFVAAQSVGVLAFRPQDVVGAINTPSIWALVGVQGVGIATIGILISTGVTSLSELGISSDKRVRARRGRAFNRGLKSITPVAVAVLLPTFVSALFADDPLVATRLTLSSSFAFFVLALSIAINEELWFRGLMVDHLERIGRPTITIVSAAVLFGLPHVSGSSASWLNAAGVTLAVAIPFTIVRIHTRSLWPLILLHALIDIWAFLHTGSVVPQGTPSTNEALLALILPMLLAVGYIAWHAGQTRDRGHAVAESSSQ